jgi:hypothetical protein
MYRSFSSAAEFESVAQRNTKFHLHQHPATRQACPIPNIVWRIVIPEKSLLSIFTQPSYWSEYSFSKGTVSAKSPWCRRTLLEVTAMDPIFSSKIHRKHPHMPGSYRLTPQLENLLGGVPVVVFSSQPRTLPCANLRWTGSNRKASERKATTDYHAFGLISSSTHQDIDQVYRPTYDAAPGITGNQ